MTTAVIIQPFFIPWLGYFDLISKADYFIFLDDVQFAKQSWQSRNRIKTPQGPIWLSIPVKKTGRISESKKIKDIQISDLQKMSDHLKIISHNYKKSRFFPEIFQIIEKSYKKTDNLVDFNIGLINEVSKYLNFKTDKFSRSSEFKISENNPTLRLTKLCQKIGADSYISGPAAKDYLEEKFFDEFKIKLSYHDYKHPVYRQLWGDFIPKLSIIDLLFNEGKNSGKIITNNEN